MAAALFNALRGHVEPEPAAAELEPKRLLVIDADPSHNWYEVFAGCTVDAPPPPPPVVRRRSSLRGAGAPEAKAPEPPAAAAPRLPPVAFPLEVEQAGWDNISLTAYSTGARIVVDIMPSRRPLPGTPQNRPRMFKPDMVLVRNEFKTIDGDHTSALLGLIYGQVGGVNSLTSILQSSDRPMCHALLMGVQRRLKASLSAEARAALGLAPGEDAFPLIEQTFYPTWRDMRITPEFPLVLKVGWGEAGWGKAVVMDHKRFEDMRSVMAMTSHYCTAEPFIEGEYDIRLQRINGNDRAFKRIGVGGSWKTQTTSSIVEALEVTPLYRLWLDEAAQLFGGLDIVTVDAIHEERTGKEYILEINGTSSGLFPDCYDEDVQDIKAVTLQRMEEHLGVQ